MANKPIGSNQDFQNTAKIVNLPDPTSDQDAATKAYVDSQVGGDTLVLNETPSGTVNGSNVTFTLANTPTSAVELTIYDSSEGSGIPLLYGVDFTVSDDTITMTTAPATGTTLRANYGTASVASSVSWGDILGTLSDQTDLQDALDDKIDTTIAPNVITANYTAAITDINKTIVCNSSSAITVSLPEGVFDDGDKFRVVNINSGLVTIDKSGGSSDTLNGNNTLVQYAGCEVQRPTATSWLINDATSEIEFSETFYISGNQTNSQVYDICVMPTLTNSATLNGVSVRSRSIGTAGTFTIAINGTSVTGLTSKANVTTRAEYSATGANTLNSKDVITFTPSGTTSVADTSITLFYTRKL